MCDAVLACCYRRRRQEKRREAAGKEESTERIESKHSAARPGFFGRMKGIKSKPPIPVEAKATPEEDIETPTASPLASREQSPPPGAKSPQWWKRSAEPRSPSTPSQSERSSSPLSNHAAKAAQKYRSASGGKLEVPAPEALGSIQSIDISFDQPGTQVIA